MDNTDQDNTTTRDRDLAPGYQKVTLAIYKAMPISLAHYESPGTQLTSILTQLALTGPEIGPWAGSCGDWQGLAALS